jgi:hypothetical protein
VHDRLRVFESRVRQTVGFEWLVVDDGSTVGTEAQVPEWTLAAAVFRVLALGFLPQTVALVIAPSWAARGRFLEATIATLSGVLNLALSMLLVRRVGPPRCRVQP